MAWLASTRASTSSRRRTRSSATSRPAAASRVATSAASRTLSASMSTCAVTSPDADWMSPERASAVWARARTSSATTAKPRPSSPALSASIAALRARRLVWSEMSATTVAISWIWVTCACKAPTTSIEASWRAALASIAATDTPICAASSISRACRSSVRRRDSSARTRDCVKVSARLPMASRDSWAAPAASSAAEAICSSDRRSCSAEAADWPTPLARSWVAATMRPEAVIWRALAVRIGLAGAGARAGAGAGAGGAAAGGGAAFRPARADRFTNAMYLPPKRMDLGPTLDAAARTCERPRATLARGRERKLHCKVPAWPFPPLVQSHQPSGTHGPLPSLSLVNSCASRDRSCSINSSRSTACWSAAPSPRAWPRSSCPSASSVRHTGPGPSAGSR